MVSQLPVALSRTRDDFDESNEKDFITLCSWKKCLNVSEHNIHSHLTPKLCAFVISEIHPVYVKCYCAELGKSGDMRLHHVAQSSVVQANRLYGSVNTVLG